MASIDMCKNSEAEIEFILSQATNWANNLIVNPTFEPMNLDYRIHQATFSIHYPNPLLH